MAKGHNNMFLLAVCASNAVQAMHASWSSWSIRKFGDGESEDRRFAGVMKLFALSTRRGPFPRLIGEPNNLQCAEETVWHLSLQSIWRDSSPLPWEQRGKLKQTAPASFTSPLVHIHLTSLFWMHASLFWTARDEEKALKQWLHSYM